MPRFVASEVGLVPVQLGRKGKASCLLSQCGNEVPSKNVSEQLDVVNN